MSTLHVQLVRFPDRHDLNITTVAARHIKALGITPLLILHYGIQSLQEDQNLIQMMNSVFGSNTTVYYEYDNEVDLFHGIDKVAYTNSWNAVIPQLKPLAPHGVFIGPVNFQINVPYLTYFVQHASPAPDAVSWHEYTCNSKVDDATCIAKIDNWSKHIAAARAAIGLNIPILITEYNWNPNPQKENDTRATNNAFLQQWQTRAIQVLTQNHVFAACHYTWSNQPALAMVNDITHTPTGSGLAFQQSYEQDIVNTPGTVTPTPIVVNTATSVVTSTPIPTGITTPTLIPTDTPAPTPIPASTATPTLIPMNTSTSTPVPTGTPASGTNDLFVAVNAVNLAIAQKGKLHITAPVVGDVWFVYIDVRGNIKAVTQIAGVINYQSIDLSAEQFTVLVSLSQS
jgi:hypothetical protein